MEGFGCEHFWVISKWERSSDRKHRIAKEVLCQKCLEVQSVPAYLDPVEMMNRTRRD